MHSIPYKAPFITQHVLQYHTASWRPQPPPLHWMAVDMERQTVLNAPDIGVAALFLLFIVLHWWVA